MIAWSELVRVAGGFMSLASVVVVVWLHLFGVVVVPLKGHTAVPGTPRICPGIADGIRRSGWNMVRSRCVMGIIMIMIISNHDLIQPRTSIKFRNI